MNLESYLEFVQDPNNMLGIAMSIGFFGGNLFMGICYIVLELSEIFNLKITNMRELRKKRKNIERSNKNE